MKKFIYLIAGLVVTFLLFGCGGTANDKGNDGDLSKELEYEETISDYLPQSDKYNLYNGYSEAGFEVKFVDRQEKESAIEYNYIGAMNDERGSEGADRTFDVKYTISNNVIIESVTNRDPLSESDKNVYSIIPDYIVLNGEIVEGNSWEQKVIIDDKEYVANTTIKEVTDETFKTVTKIEMEGYKDEVYIEERTYVKDIGLTYFSSTPYGSDEDDMLVFGYIFTIEFDESVTGLI